MELYGGNCPALNRHDLANIARNVSKKIKQLDIDSLDKELKPLIDLIPERIQFYKSKALPYIFDGNCATAVPSYMALINWILQTIDPLFSWEVLQDNKALPHQLAKRLSSVQAQLDELIPEKDILLNQISLIKEATQAAETLPADLGSLKKAREVVDKVLNEANIIFNKIETLHKHSDDMSKSINATKKEVEKLVEQCGEAYKITTTKGLAAAFDDRAIKLNHTMLWWVGSLAASLLAGLWIGTSRFEALVKTLESSNPQWGIIWVEILLSLVGLAAPIWFAWIATKQINQRFKLSEDYAFKASVAKAYEGYKREAARIDEAFEARLFSSALTRLEEAPLRLVEKDNFGSPLHDFFSSKKISKGNE